MKLLVLAALVAVAASGPVSESQSWPWQVGKAYYYDVESFSWTKYQESSKVGNSFKSKFIVRVKAPGRLLAKLENPLYAQAQTLLDGNTSDLQFDAVEKIDQAFEIKVEGGRVLSLNLPSSFSSTYENLIKGLVSALQVDLTSFGAVRDYPNTYDKSTFQGLFKKFEADVTGDCETLYSVSPLSAAWRLELPKFTSEEDPIEIVKSKNYGTCNKRTEFNFYVPEGAVWQGYANGNERQLIKYTTEARIIAGKQGNIYKSEVVSSAFVAPLLVGKQKAEVYSFVKLYLNSVEQDTGAEWQLSEATKTFDSLLYTLNWSEFGASGDEAAVANAQKLLQELTPLLQNNNNLPKADFLSKFNVLARLLFTATSEQLNVLTSSVEIARSSKNVAKNNMWIIYRDAVAQAGSQAAFKEAKSWILNKKIEGEEAAKVISAIATGFAWPSKQDAKELYELAFNPVVTEQRYLNTTTLLAAAKVYRRIDDDEFVKSTFIPRLDKELKQAIEKGDSKNAQLYIRVLANLDSEEVLKVFAPYLGGTVPTTKYLRIQMVGSLRKLANEKNEVVRSVLYSILRNTGEPYEIRAAAAISIILAFPTPDMLEVMAHMTNDDPSTQVRSILQSSIVFAADRLKDPRFAELTKNARAVKNIVAKDTFGFRYSADSMIDSYTGDDDIGFFRQFAYIGSEDSALPKYHHSSYRAPTTDGNDEYTFVLSTTDIKLLIDYALGLFTTDTKSGYEFKFSAKKIIELLTIQRSPRDDVEGALYLDIFSQERLFTFTENELSAFLLEVVTNAKQYFDGKDTYFTKILNQKQTYVTFPLASGMPFFLEYSAPMLLSLVTNFNAEKAITSGQINQKVTITYARNYDGRVGFLDTIGKKFATSGVVVKYQVYAPIDFKVALDAKALELTFTFPEQDTTVIHKSVWPYTSVQKYNTLTSILEESTTKLIEGPITEKRTKDVVVGEWTGMAYSVKGYSYSTDYRNFEKKFTEVNIQTLFNLLYQKDVALTEFNFKYLAKETKNKEIKISTLLSSLYNQNEEGELGTASETSVLTDSETRIKDLSKQVSKGIKSANVKAIDISTVFNGEQKIEFVFTSAYADSNVDSKIQGGFYFYGFDQITGVYKINSPKIVPLNFEEALKNEIKQKYEGNFKVVGKLDVDFEGFGEQTETYKEVLKNDPHAKHCLKDISNNNLYQNDCYKLLIKAHTPDFFKGKFTYKQKAKIYYELDFFYQAYKYFKQIYSLEVQENPLKTVADGTVEFNVQAFYDELYANYEIVSKFGALNVKNVKGWPHYAYRMAIFGPINAWERSYNIYAGYQHLPFCAVDYSKVFTFSGRSYDYSLSSSWHVVMVDEYNQLSQWSDLVILARRPSDNQEEVYISYENEGSKYIEVEIKPTGVEVKTNAEKTSEGAVTSYWDDKFLAPLLEYYYLADGVQVFSIKNNAIRIIYDKQRLIIFTDGYRKTTRGLCGQSSSQVSDDYLTPWGLVSKPEYYGASFSLDGEYSDPKTAELKKEAKLNAYQPVTKYTSIFRKDDDWNKTSNRSV